MGLKRHQLQHQSMEYMCTVCNRQFAFPSELSTHQTIHSEEKKYKCQYPRCNGEYKTKAEYHRHYKTHSPSSNDYKCLVCKNVFKKEKYLWEHKQAHTDELPFACDHCGEWLKWQSGRHNHIQAKHQSKESLSDEF